MSKQLIEDELNTIVKDLQEKHADKYTLPHEASMLGMITSGKHPDRDNIPAFLDLDDQPKRKRPTLAEAITDAAKLFAQATKSPNMSQCSSQSVVIASSRSPSTPVASCNAHDLPVSTGISPGKVRPQDEKA